MEKFDEYKLLYERTQKLSERRQTTSQTYLTINTAIFGAIAFLVKDSGLTGSSLIAAISPLFAVGVLICIIWLSILFNLEKILNWQYKQLRELEGDMRGSARIFTRENKEFFETGKDKKKFSFTLLEGWLPGILGAVYLVYLLGMVIAVRQGAM
ncbi:MAG: hypothetical protein HZB19_06395 [Chloroflexi bacterium]|nr:hypothetical protein [Chloroflexota bacterium]